MIDQIAKFKKLQRLHIFLVFGLEPALQLSASVATEHDLTKIAMLPNLRQLAISSATANPALIRRITPFQNNPTLQRVDVGVGCWDFICAARSSYRSLILRLSILTPRGPSACCGAWRSAPLWDWW
jgi:hypothetical protein